MRVLHLLSHTNRLNGHVHAAVDLACAQVKLGHEVAVASRGGDFDALLAANNVETRIIPQERRVLEILRALVSLRRFVREWRPDIVHAHMVTSAVVAMPICKLAGIPLITTVHNAFEKSAVLMGVGSRVIAVSDVVGRSMRRRGIPQSKLEVVLNGTIGAARFDGKDRTPRQLAKPSIIFVGGLHPRKGLPDLIKAFEIVRHKVPAATLTILGDGPHRQEYEALARISPAAEAITFLGGLDEPFPFLLGADIFVLPSHADPAPLVLSEAREAGCAIVATAVDGVPQLLEGGKAGLLTPARDPSALAAAITDLICTPGALQAWRNNSQVSIGYLTIERVAIQTLKIYTAASRQLRGRELQPAN